MQQLINTCLLIKNVPTFDLSIDSLRYKFFCNSKTRSLYIALCTEKIRECQSITIRSEVFLHFITGHLNLFNFRELNSMTILVVLLSVNSVVLNQETSRLEE